MTRPAIHPGAILAEELAELGMSASALARALDVPPNRMTQILRSSAALRPKRRCAWAGGSV